MAATPPDVLLREMCWNVDVWFQSDTFLGNDLEVHGAYLNLCFASFRRQPTCVVPDDDGLLWRLAGCASVEQWRTLRERVLRNFEPAPGGLVHPVVLETYQTSLAKVLSASRSGSIGGKASAVVRRARIKAERNQQDRTTVERPLNGTSSVGVGVGDSKAVAVPTSPLEPLPRRTEVGPGKPVPDSWSGRFCQDWKEIVSGDGGAVPGGNIGNSLRNLVHKLSEERVRPVWQHYLRTEARPVPRYFAENFAKWEAAAKAGRGLFDRPTLVDRNAKVGAEWEAEMRRGQR